MRYHCHCIIHMHPAVEFTTLLNQFEKNVQVPTVSDVPNCCCLADSTKSITTSSQAATDLAVNVPAVPEVKADAAATKPKENIGG